jgi:uncharacterized ion transporter superfamily protein YfcC
LATAISIIVGSARQATIPGARTRDRLMTSRFPHPLTLLTAGIILAAALTYLLPAGEYDRRPDPVTGRQVVVSGTFHRVPARPVGIFDALVAIPKGLAEAGSVVFLVFLVGGAFTVVDETGALRQAVDWLVRRMQRREALMIPIVSVAFAAGGALENMSEEIIALVPVLLLVTRRLGFDALTAVAISIGAAGVGAAFSPINPFQAQIAQKLAGLPLLSGAGFRMILLVLALAVWIWGTWRHAVPHPYRTAGERCRRRSGALGALGAAILVIVLATFAVFMYGVMRLGWDFDQMSALFFAMGVVCGLIGGLGMEGTARSFVTGFAAMAFACARLSIRGRAHRADYAHQRRVDGRHHRRRRPLRGLAVVRHAALRGAPRMGGDRDRGRDRHRVLAGYLLFDPLLYSRSATIGSMRVARRAGM